MTIKALNPLDASWLLVESRETPMHVGGLTIFQLPEDAPADFFLDLMADFRGTHKFAAPWDQKLRSISLKGLMPVWESTEEIDLEHHVRHAALPQPGGERELGQLIARLHSQPLDLTRPPWECSLIEGLENRRFALYVKMHHSLIDGISGMKMLVRAMSSNAQESRKLPAFWAIGAGKSSKKLRSKTVAAVPTTAEAAAEAWSLVRDQVTSVPGVLRAFGSMLGGLTRKKDKMMVPFDTPSSIFNGRIKGQRRFATQIYAISRLRNVAQAAGATLNDVVLAICGAALRRFLLDLDALPKKPLTAGIPVSVRPKDDEGTGNAITFIISTLATDVEDPLERLQAISASTKLAKEHVQSLPRKAMMQYTMVLMAPYMVSLVAGVGGRTRPMFNITISNVPGPEEELYFRGARMEATYPVSLVSHGQALNITCQSYGGNLAFGFTGCRDTLPHMQRIATYTGEALEELENALAAQSKGGRSKPKAAAGRPAGEKRPALGVANKPKARVKTVKAKPDKPLAAAGETPAVVTAEPSSTGVGKGRDSKPAKAPAKTRAAAGRAVAESALPQTGLLKPKPAKPKVTKPRAGKSVSASPKAARPKAAQANVTKSESLESSAAEPKAALRNTAKPNTAKPKLAKSKAAQSKIVSAAVGRLDPKAPTPAMKPPINPGSRAAAPARKPRASKAARPEGASQAQRDDSAGAASRAGRGADTSGSGSTGTAAPPRRRIAQLKPVKPKA